MNYLFLHNNFPAQFQFIAQALVADPSNQVAAIGSQTSQPLPGVTLIRYHFDRGASADVHPFARRFDQESRRAECVLYALSDLEASGFCPDIIIVHSGWGEALPLRAVFPSAKLVAYSEFYYRSDGADVNFDPEFPRLSRDGRIKLAAHNAAQLLALTEADAGWSPTEWQRSVYPGEFRSKITVVHEGVDTDTIRPSADARLELPSGTVLSPENEIVTFVARNLEPLRGYHVFMRALPELMRRRPNAQVVIAGGDGISYGAAPPHSSWKEIFLTEVEQSVDPNRLHFLGKISYESYLRLLQVSTVHVYLTYPFVLSWSLIEALSAGCLVIGSDTAPVHEVISTGRNGLLVPFFDTGVLADTMCVALSERSKFTPIRRRARASAIRHYDRARVCLPRLLTSITSLRSQMS